jgi:UDP-glucose 4-epimerase
MRTLITGGAGLLGSVLGPYLQERGHAVTLLDCRPCISVCPSVLADVQDGETLLRAIDGHNTVIHAAALHGVHVNSSPTSDFVSVNVLGTHNVLEASRVTGVKRVLLASSTSVYGVSRTKERQAAVIVNEETPLLPADLNDLCKVLSEHLCSFYARQYGLSCIALRFGRFSRDDWVASNLYKLFGGADVMDIAQAAFLAAEATALEDDVFCISARTRFTAEDAPRLIGQADTVIEQHYPGTRKLFEMHGIQLPRVIHRIVDIRRAESQLKYAPQRNFEEFLQELAERAGKSGNRGPRRHFADAAYHRGTSQISN